MENVINEMRDIAREKTEEEEEKINNNNNIKQVYENILATKST